MESVELHYLSIPTHGFDIDLITSLDILDEDERQRYHRFKNDHAQQCFLQARRIVKTELAKKLGCLPCEILFSYGETEKPRLKDRQDWHFNISHSHSSIVVALCKSPVGVDVEDVDRCEKIWPKAEDFLNLHVKECVSKQSSSYAAAACFAEHWSCTESYIKLRGSAIYREKDRVKSELHGDFSGGKYYAFEDVCFTVFDFAQAARIAVAVECDYPEIIMHYWRNGQRKKYSPKRLALA